MCSGLLSGILICNQRRRSYTAGVRVLHGSIRRTGEDIMSELELGNTLYKLYHTVVKLEATELRDNKNCADLTVNELNLIECIRSLTKGNDGPKISSIASELDITRPSTTVAVNKLCSKRIAEKSECSNDGRSVKVKLTAKGEKAYNAHHTFQNSLIKSAKQDMSEEEYGKIADSLGKLCVFLNSKVENSETNE